MYKAFRATSNYGVPILQNYNLLKLLLMIVDLCYRKRNDRPFEEEVQVRMLRNE